MPVPGRGTPAAPAPRPLTTLCPYCGHVSGAAGARSCERCRGLFEPLSRQASQNAMGPWFIRDEANPFLPGFSLATLRQLVRRGRIVPDTIIKGPSTRQFWSYARNVPGVAHLLGSCHICRAAARPTDVQCAGCGASFEVPDDRENLGLAPVRLLPGQADAAEVAAAASAGGSRPPVTPEIGEPAVGAEVDADRLIAARHRRRRAQRRTTVGIVVAGLGLIGLIVALMVSQSARRSDQTARPGEMGGPTGNVLPEQSPKANPDEQSNPPDVEIDADRPAQSPTASTGLEPPDLARLLLSATVNDLPDLLRRAKEAVESGGTVDARLRGAIEAAEARVAAMRAAEKL